MSKPVIAVVGTGYVGLTSAVVFANAGYKTYTIDIDQHKIDVIKKGKSFFYEVGLDDLIENALESQMLIPTTSFEEGIPEADFVFSCVGTPDRADGSPNLDFIYSASESVAKLAKDGVVFIQKSTVPVGTGRKLIEYISEQRPALKFEYVSNPEFLREGSALFDTLNMDRIVVGNEDEVVLDRVLAIYKDVDEYSRKFDFAKISEFAGVTMPRIKMYNEQPFEERSIKTSLESAELIKVSANAFLSLKISFANSIAMLCDKAGADVKEVMNGVGMDGRIGRAFLYAGRGYGGGCFPKDVSGLISVADQHGVDLQIMKASSHLNDQMPEYILSKIKTALPDLTSVRVAFLGLSFKPGTSDVRKSPSIKLANLLSQAGAAIRAYDPEANEEAKESLKSGVELCESVEVALKDSDIIVVATDWPQFTKTKPDRFKMLSEAEVLVDCMNALDKREFQNAGYKYIGVGR